jgi:hypothetical protein
MNTTAILGSWRFSNVTLFRRFHLNPIRDPFQIPLADGDSCPEFGQWQRLQASGVVVDFRRIRRIGSGFGALVEYEFDLSRINETSGLKRGPISTKVYQGVDDGCRIVVKSVCRLNDIESERFQQEIENLVNLRYPCIVCPIGFVLPSQSQSQLWGSEIVRLYYWGGSLSEVISVSPEWWTV